MAAARIELLVTTGTFTLDGGTWDVDNNVWILGDDREAIVIDAAHDAATIAAAVGDRTLRAIVCTHAQTPGEILKPKKIGAADLARCEELGATIAAGLALGIY